jgi:hypothetical protein
MPKLSRPLYFVFVIQCIRCLCYQMLSRHFVLSCTVVIVKRKNYKKPYSLNIEINIWNSTYIQIYPPQIVGEARE